MDDLSKIYSLDILPKDTKYISLIRMKNFTRIHVLFLLILLNTTSFTYAEVNANSLSESNEPIQQNEQASEYLSYIDCILLGLVEGITEYLPISSTGHLLISNELLGLNSDIPISDEYSLKEAAFAYIIIIQAGAILAVLYLYWKTILEILMGFFGKNPKGRKLGLLLIVRFFPAAVIGLALNDWIEQQLGDNLIAIALALFSRCNRYAYYRKKAKKAPNNQPQFELEALINSIFSNKPFL